MHPIMLMVLRDVCHVCVHEAKRQKRLAESLGERKREKQDLIPYL